MRRWHYRLHGIRKHLMCEEEDATSLRTASAGIVEGLERFIERLKNPPASLTRQKDYGEWAIPEYGIDELEQIVDEMRDAGGVGAVDWQGGGL